MPSSAVAHHSSIHPSIMVLLDSDILPSVHWRSAQTTTPPLSSPPAHHFEEGPLGSVGKYLSPRPAQVHELIPGATMECIATAKKDLVMKYGPVFVDAEALKNQQTLEKYPHRAQFTTRSSILMPTPRYRAQRKN
ncbi:uncharacterized protein C8R40DRAFT_1178966 [Lentinula edodes]|uniref:uncharacterized protein n=1 Tax=Lentinula edodes TaxID=5353 RepID=UPI001E8CE3FD|nr:uncharacterized protein C8R40DRAFT_1178966 [Lentinula edodes]KAH7867606.1 hypothetical protein C8R40DRAFT_1178966 [Lentinula edodes]